MPAVELRGLCREYGERPVLRDISLELEAGETLAILGPNGAGKSTLLRILATLLRPSAGSVAVLGCELPRQAWRLRPRLGYLGHAPLLYRDLTVAENLAFQGRLHGLPDAGRGRAALLLESVGMAARAGELTHNLSRGMAQRVAVCRALLHEPELLLLDEPFAHLDPEGAALVAPLLGAEPGRTRILVTHDPATGIAGADALLGLSHRGDIGFSGRPSDVSETELASIYAGAIA
jgi:heme exporter protein A